jgi:outer membrane protein assembly factor BamB
MRTQAQGLSTPQIFQLILYIAPTGAANAPSLTRTCKGDSSISAAAFNLAMNAPRWNGWSTSATNSRFQDRASAGMTASNVTSLKLKWAFNLGAVTIARSQPAVVGGRVYIATATGAVYSLDVATGGERAASVFDRRKVRTAADDADGTDERTPELQCRAEPLDKRHRTALRRFDAAFSAPPMRSGTRSSRCSAALD